MSTAQPDVQPPIRTLGEAERKSQDLIDAVRQLVETLNPPPDLHDVRKLHQLTTELLSVVATINDLQGETLQAQAIIKNWRAANSENIQILAQLLSKPLSQIDSLLQGDRVKPDTLTCLLDTCSALIAHGTKVLELQQNIKTATDNLDHAQLSLLIQPLSSATHERTQTLAQIESQLEQLTAPHPDDSSTTHRDRPGTTHTAASSIKTDHPDTTPSPTGTTDPEPTESDPPNTSVGATGSDTKVANLPGTNTDRAADELPKQYEKTIAEALARGRFGVAYHMTQYTSDTLLNSNAIKLIAMNYANDDNGSVTAELSNLAASLYGHTREVLKRADLGTSERDFATVLATAAFKPAIQAPGGPVAQFLTSLRPLLNHVPTLQSLASELARISLQGAEIPLASLNRHKPPEDWTTRKNAMRKKIDHWIKAERQSRLLFGRATKVWHKLLSTQPAGDRASIGWICDQIKKDQPAPELLDRAKNTVEDLRQHKDKEIDRLDRSLRPIASTRKIEGAARIQLRKKIDEGVALISEWNILLASQSTKAISHQVEQMNRLLKAVEDHRTIAAQEITALDSPFTKCACDLMGHYLGLFESARRDPSEKTAARLELLLHGDLLLDPEIEFSDNSEVLNPPSVPQLIDLASRNPQSEFDKAAIERANNGDFYGSSLALDFAEQRNYLDDDAADQIRANIESIREAFVQNLLEDIRQTSDKLDATYALGALDITEVNELRKGILSRDVSAISRVSTFKPIISELAKINRRVETAKADRKKEMREELLAVEADVSDDDRTRIEVAIGRERFLIAGEYIEWVKKGYALPSDQDEPEPLFDRFFPTFVSEYSSLKGDASNIRTLVLDAIQQSKAIGPVDASRLSPDSAGDAVALVKSWFALTDSRDSQAKHLSTLLTALGFQNVKIKATGHPSASGHPRFELNASTVSSRDVCPLPDFGSRAAGRYRLLIVRGKNTAEAVIQEIGSWTREGESPVVVIFAGLLDHDQRILLSSSFHFGEFHPTLVLDESLLMFVALEGADRLPALFNCATPFSFTQPFDPDAAEVPPEMFVGRKSARKAILSRAGGTHLVYGGRRLGKTALLADIAREFRGGDNAVLVLLINLRGTGIGENKPTSEFWRLVGAELSPHRVVGYRAVQYRAISEGVTKWLGESESRRILLLVDEADSFLDAERLADPKYRVLDAIKRLMEKTHRRFKVVFAGLHNVQRTARDPNTPIAHLGMPVQIGAMLPESDGGEIEQLILNPLKALGYRFASRDSVTRIAAETNYYPALVQQFCKELLEDLRTNSHGSQEGPPYFISPEAVDRVFSAKETRDRIRDLFSWTIELDPRYKFLTYLIAWHCLDGSEGDAPLRGVSIDEIREDTLREWPQGFSSDDSFLTFEVLLDEMVGLGILSEEDNEGRKSFVIRSRNLRRLLGQIDEIERRLIDASNEAAPAQFDPVHFRNTFRQRSGAKTSRRHKVSEHDLISPLIAAQENTLLSYSDSAIFMFGTKLSGVDRVPEALGQLSHRTRESDSQVTVYNEVPSTVVGTFEKIKRQSSRRPGVQIYLVLVDCRDSGSLCREQIGVALREVSSNRSKNRIIRPVFLGGPEFAWNWISNGRVKGFSRGPAKEIWLGPCTRDFARIWLQDHVERKYRDIEDADGTSDSLWPVVVEAAMRNDRIRTIKEAVSHVVDTGLIDLSDVLKIQGLEQPLRLLASSPSEPVARDDLTGLLSDLELERDGVTMSAEEIDNLMEWSHDLGIVRTVASNSPKRDSLGYHMDGAWASGLARIFGE